MKQTVRFLIATRVGTLLFLTFASPFSFAQASHPASGLGTLGGLILPREGTPKHEGSWDRKGGNEDMIHLEPGETRTLWDYNGAGIVRRFWATIAPRSDKEIHRQLILQMYWDGETSPSVVSPIGDFFGVGFGEQKDYQSLPLNEVSGGYNCYWAMPFHKSVRWTLTNRSKKRVDAFYYNIDFTAYDKLPKETLHFHAQWNRENPTKPGQNYTILDAKGRGHFVGVALFMQNRKGRGLGFLEGDEMIYLEGEKTPSITGTGTEDYFSSGWYYDRGEYSAPYHGINLKDTENGRISTYRWHIEDAMPFKRSIRVTIEHGTQNDHEGDYSSVAYWYQTEPHAPFSPLPANAAALLPFVLPPPFKIANAIEGEALKPGAVSSNGPVDPQDTSPFTGDWSGNSHLWWRPSEAGTTLTLQLPAPADGTYELIAYFTKARDYGTIQVQQGGIKIGGEVNLYNPEVSPTGAISLGRITLKRGNNPLSLHNVGKDVRSTGYSVAIDAFVLKKL
ncbi:MAG: DUF2961 domain-containing protein [Chthonomonadaceae bacterium]|nr:DUF2961 domain-containing protein [Chthonomonadaceae bacterium]